MAGGDVPPATASGPGVPYAEWPAPLGDPRWHRDDFGGSAIGAGAKSRAEIVAQYRRRRPEIHGSVPVQAQLAQARDVEHKSFPTARDCGLWRLCSFEAQCHRGRATKKCHHCVQFDPLKLGFYCDACFDARHPPYRVAHSWTSLHDEVDPEQSWMTHLVYHNLEQDARELQLLLAQTQSFLRTHGSPPQGPPSRPATRTEPRPPPADALAKMRSPTGDLDFQRVRESVTRIASTLKALVEQIHTELDSTGSMTREDARLKIQAMWRIRRARKQMRALIQSVYQSFTDPTTGRTYYYNTRTKETKWTKPKALGSGELPRANRNQERDAPAIKPKKQSKLHKLRQVAGDDDEHSRAYATKCIQGMARAHAARRHFRVLISSVYEKIWDSASSRFYYHNTKTDEVKWERPRWVSDDELLTPRTRDALRDQSAKEQKDRKLAELRACMTLDGAASMVQRAFRRRRGFRLLLELCRSVYERIYDADAGRYYYHNTRTKAVTWDKPRLLRGAQADVFSPRTRDAHARARLRSAMRKRGDRPPVRVEWTPDAAAARLQAVYRARRARHELDARLAQSYKKVWDPESERFYYANLATGAVSWDAPAILQRRAGHVELEEVR